MLLNIFLITMLVTATYNLKKHNFIMAGVQVGLLVCLAIYFYTKGVYTVFNIFGIN